MRLSWIAVPLLAALVSQARADAPPVDHRGVLMSAGLLVGSGSATHATVSGGAGWGVTRTIALLARGSLTQEVDRNSGGYELGLGARFWPTGSRVYVEPQLGGVRYGYPEDCIFSGVCVGGVGTGVALGLEAGGEVVRAAHIALELRAGVTRIGWRDQEGSKSLTFVRAGLGISFR